MTATLTELTEPESTTVPSWALEMKLKSCSYRPQTINAYLGQLRAFFRYIEPKDPRRLSDEEILEYLVYLNNSRKSRSTVDQAINALRFLWNEIYEQPFPVQDIPRPEKKNRVPVILTLDEVKRIAVAAENLKHRLMIEVAYSAGLRVSELVATKVGDVNLAEKALFVKGEGKNPKGRTTIFSGGLKDAIARQIGNKKPEDYLFPSERGGKLTTRAFAKYFKAALEASGVKKEATPHSLRHSFATFLLHNGVGVAALQNLLGHVRRESTSFYQKVFKPALAPPAHGH